MIPFVPKRVSHKYIPKKYEEKWGEPEDKLQRNLKLKRISNVPIPTEFPSRLEAQLVNVYLGTTNAHECVLLINQLI